MKLNFKRKKIFNVAVSLIVIGTIIILVSADLKSRENQLSTDHGLKDYFENKYYIGVAIPQWFLEDGKEKELIEKHFNSITSENDMKWQSIHPEEDKYNFNVADRFVSFGNENDMFVVGHTLVWHSQLAPWVLKPVQTGDPAKDTLMVDSSTLKIRIKDHIETIVGRYKGKVHGWDVVNEALNDDGTFRESGFYKILGKGFISYSFKIANQVDPEAELYYNDYNLVMPDKRAGAVGIVKMLKEEGVQIDGVGIQAHWALDHPSLEEIEKSILAYSDLGVQVMFTELDVSVLPSPWRMPSADISVRFQNNEAMNPYTDGMPDSIQTALAQRYEDIFELFNKHKDKISRVTFWGLHDGVSWKNGFPIRGRTDYPLLFDRNLKPKKAYHSVIGTAED